MENIEKVEFTPLNISDEELADIPDCQFYVCEYDVLKNDGQIMHARLQKLKKNTQITLIEGKSHQFFSLNMSLTYFKVVSMVK